MTAYQAGELAALFGIPTVGLILLILGLRQRSRSRRPPPYANPMGPSGYPPPSPHQPGYPPSQPAAYPPPYPVGYPAPPPRGSRGTALIIVGSVLLGLGGLGILSQVAKTASRVGQSSHAANVGQCISAFSVRENNFAPAPQDCDKSDSTLEVAAKGDGASATCPDGKRQGSDYSILFDGTTTLCLLINLRQDHCYSMSGGPKTPTFVAASCDGSLVGIKVVKRVDGSTDAGLCPSGTKPISYPTPARLYCLERLES